MKIVTYHDIGNGRWEPDRTANQEASALQINDCAAQIADSGKQAHPILHFYGVVQSRQYGGGAILRAGGVGAVPHGVEHSAVALSRLI